MITHIRVKNFKSWQDSGNVGLAPLTGFFGTNSSGKSSLLQMLLLLKQTVGSKDKVLFSSAMEILLSILAISVKSFMGINWESILNLNLGCELQTHPPVSHLQDF